ncbi:tRNA lysidine(34) synthetase TilS [Salinisphaera sp.]|uniref:tRNA lysidine(34) synthetase TilS n=1 Tax=Salinisphaera sp. TaxID=1914330 RepID=UPI002D777227|nr:tRNA lysidine(34) synthetase TilS [Salinisphaera sp.]HET7315014.1 tRNA lysidine(34) synthetase TilS [Salinisphaera sp.]
MNAQTQLTAALTPGPPNTSALVVAYSGGRDSTALLYALAHSGPAIAIRAVHICHRLETAAEAWAEHCRRCCEALGIDFVRRDIQVDTRRGGLEAAARAARYAELRRWIGPNEVLVTAHHADDQAETFLLQALRGAGVAGLAGMPALAAFGAGRLWRPWLDVPRAAITAYAQAHGLEWVEDETNRDSRRARGYLRSEVWPALIAQWPAAAETLSRSAGWAAQATEAIAALAEVDRAAVGNEDATLAIPALSELSFPRQSEVLRWWLAEQGRDRPGHRHVAEIRRLLGAREHAGPRVAFASTEVRRFDGRLFAMARLPAAPAPGTVIEWPIGCASLALPPGCGRIAIEPNTQLERPHDLRIVFNEPGARMARAGGGSTPVSEWLRGARVPTWVRQRLPRIQAGDTLLAVPGTWRHPEIAQWFGGRAPRFEWEHDLPGARQI